NSKQRDIAAMSHEDHINLPGRAYRAMVEEGFAPDLTPEMELQLNQMEANPQPDTSGAALRDLRTLLWSSIDNDESWDLDQVEAAEALPNGNIRVRVGIADVDAFVPQDSPIDRHACANTVSVYTGVRTFPMLPERLSNDTTSLLEGVGRAAIVTEM